jgi:hypothetical protein
MNPRELESLLRACIYLLDEEQKHWEEEGKPKDHIYNDAVRLYRWYARQEEKKNLAKKSAVTELPTN